FRVNVPFYVLFLCQGKYLQRIDLGCMLVYRSILAAKRKVVKDLIEISEKIENVRLSDDGTKVIILDQEKLPNAEEYLELDNAEDIYEAIFRLKVRGAPAIGICAGYGIYVLARQIDTEDFDSFYKEFKQKRNYLDSSRPTAVNLSWALNR